MPELTLSASVIGLIIMAVSFFKIYRVKNITVAYKDQYGKIRGYEIKDIYNLTDPWINVETVEAYIAEKRNCNV